MRLFKDCPISNTDIMGESRDMTVDVLILQLSNILFNQQQTINCTLSILYIVVNFLQLKFLESFPTFQAALCLVKKNKKNTFVRPAAGRKDIVKKNILGDAFKDIKWSSSSNNRVAENSKHVMYWVCFCNIRKRTHFGYPLE